MSLNNHLLIAMPIMQDPIFKKAVIYVCEHNEYGAIGLMINRPMEYRLRFVFQQMNISVTSPEANDMPLLFGGPVQQERGFVVHKTQGEWRSSLPLANDLSITTSNDILQAVAVGNAPSEILVILGYAGWDALQLETELAQNSWLTCKATHEILFKVPFHERWEAAAKSLGINIHTLSTDTGHA